jgi:hypothetical protein
MAESGWPAERFEEQRPHMRAALVDTGIIRRADDAGDIRLSPPSSGSPLRRGSAEQAAVTSGGTVMAT